jgi:hypothetical protein
MTFNTRGGNYMTDYDAATQDYELKVSAPTGSYLMVIAVSIHDQEHSIRVRL